MHFISEELESYIAAHTSPQGNLLDALENETWRKILVPRMISGHVQGRALSMFSKMISPKNILEIGTYTGFSALCLAEGLKDEGRLDTIEVNDELCDIQDKFWDMSPQGKFIHRHLGEALNIMPGLNRKYDLIFIDADKDNYLNYYAASLDLLNSGGYIMLDNVLWSGKVVDPAAQKDSDTIKMNELNRVIQEDERVENVLLGIRDGIMMVRKI
ncbi:MAG: class I SAM-dependent methyltransferase [Flavobacteriales bacterium]|nr:class I SAM-dependent methyltransferase [Flavobacteriales bacterium]MDG1765523.1 class I SAM-dependent methyltransferase [Flavobacteriales bacterium]